MVFFLFFCFFVCFWDRILKEEVGIAEVGCGLWFSQVRCYWVLLVVEDCQCLGPVLLGFWVAQIGDGFGGDRRGSLRGHGEVLLWIGVDPMGFAMDFDGHHRTSQSCPSPI